MDEFRRRRHAGLRPIRWATVKADVQALPDASSTHTSLLFLVFCLCAFVVLGRPQDVFPFIAPFRPALLLEALTLFLLFLYYSDLAPGISFNNRQLKLFMALIGVMAVSIPFAYHRGLAFMSVIDFLKLALFFLLFFVIADSADSVKIILKIACLGVFMYTVFSLRSGIQDRLIAGGMFDANDLSFFIISFLPFNFLFLDRENPFYMRIVAILNLGLGSLATLMTGSRGGFVSLLAVFIIMLFSRTRTIKVAYKVMFVVLCLALVFFKSGSIDFGRLSTAFAPGEDYNLTDEWGRKDIWERGVKLMISRPLTGVGVGCFDMAIGEGRLEEGRIPRWQTAHNSLIQIGAETGIVGLGLFLLLSLYAYRTFSTAAGKGSSKELVMIGEMARIGFAGQFIAGMFLSQAYSPHWVFYIALSAAFVRLLKDEAVTLPHGKESPLIGRRVPVRRVKPESRGTRHDMKLSA